VRLACTTRRLDNADGLSDTDRFGFTNTDADPAAADLDATHSAADGCRS
jgi:hypothetical protein